MVGDNRLKMKQDNISTEMAMSNIEKTNLKTDKFLWPVVKRTSPKKILSLIFSAIVDLKKKKKKL